MIEIIFIPILAILSRMSGGGLGAAWFTRTFKTDRIPEILFGFCFGGAYLLIGLPVGGLPLAILYPLAYEIGQPRDRADISELLAGAFSGVSIVLFLLTMEW